MKSGNEKRKRNGVAVRYGKQQEHRNSKKYYGFALGAILVMIAKQYSYLQDRENELVYYQSAKACLDPRAVYMPLVEKKLKELEA